ncbi:MAG: hypothetical protein JNL03_08630 [Prolixibacteraceae bacterium]|nr:hypothetical protein [Prolixibacteraceae bacterium]
MAIRCAKPAQENPATRVINIVYLLSASAVLLGSLFKLQHYPYGAALLLIGIVGGAIAGMADYGWSRKIGNKSEEQNRP